MTAVYEAPGPPTLAPHGVLPVVLVRVPCLAVEELPPAGTARLLHADRQHRHDRALLAEQGQRLADRLAAVVPAFDRSGRAAVLRLRRDLHNGRGVPPPAGAALPAVLDRDVRQWAERLRVLQQAERLTAAAWSGAEQASHHALEQLLREPRFATALAVGHPDLAVRADRLPPASEGWGRREKALASTLLLLAWRAALCPVPLARYAATASGVWQAAPAPVAIGDLTCVGTAGPEQLARVTGQALGSTAVLERVELAVTGGVLTRADGPWLLRSTATDLRVDPLPAPVRQVLTALPGGIAATGAELLRRGVPQEAVRQAVGSGALRVRWPGDRLDQRAPDPHALRQSVWGAALEDIALLPALHLVADGVDDEFPLDSACREPVGLPAVALDPVLRDLTRLGVELAEQQATPERQALARLLDVCCGGRPTPLLALLLRSRELLVAAGAPTGCLASPAATVAPLGLQVAQHSPLDDALPAGVPELVFGHLGAPGWAAPPAATLRRAVARLVLVPGRLGGAGARVAFWGGDRMSLLPRYAALPLPDAAGLVSRYRTWLAGWPDLVDLDLGSPSVVDLRERFTPRRLAGPEAGRCRPGDLTLENVVVAPEGDDVRLLDARDGRLVDPVYLGVVAAGRLPLPFRLLLAIGPARRTALDLGVDVVNRRLAALCSTLDDAVALPAVWLTDALQLLPPTLVLPARALPLPDSGPAGALRALDRWAERQGVELGWTQVRQAGLQAEPLVLDLANPIGAARLARLARSTPEAVLLLSRCDPAREGLAGASGRVQAELVVEVRG